MSRRRLARRCEEQLRALDLPRDLSTVEDLVEVISAWRGVPITLVEHEFPHVSAYAAWAPDLNTLFYDRRAAPYQLDVSICHELGHVILDHEPDADAGAFSLPVTFQSEAAAIMLSGRTCDHDTDDERAAELLGRTLVNLLDQARQDARRLNEPLEVALRRRRRRR